MKRNLLRWKRLGSTLLAALALCLTQVAVAQNASVTGTVVDAENQEPVVGALVRVVGASSAVATDVNGMFSLQAPSNAVLQVSFLGYKTQQVAVSGRSSVGTIALASDAQQLEQVVVTGYGGTTTRAKSTASIATVPKQAFEVGSYSNPSAAIQGMIPGLRVQTISGQPGATSNMVLRGGTNLTGGGSPLIMVDGQIRGSMSDISSDDIESMDVLKDAAATAIYGARANNGVILITTKKGKAGRSSVTGSVKIGVNFLNMPVKMTDARDYLYWTRRSQVVTEPHYGGRVATLSTAQPYGTGNLFKDNKGNFIDGNKNGSAYYSTMYLNNDNRFKLNQGWDWMIDPVRDVVNASGDPAKDTLIFNNFDWASEAFQNPALTQDYNIAVSGGNDKGSYFASVGWYDEQGLPINTWYNRLSFLFNGDYQVAKWLKAESSVNFVEAKWRNTVTTSAGNYFGRMLAMPPTFRGKNEEGDWLIGRGSGDELPVINDEKYIRRNQSDKFTFIQGFKVNFLPKLYLKINAQWMFEESTAESFNKDFIKGVGPSYDRVRNSSASFDRTLRQTYNALLNFDTNFGGSKHTFNGLVGMEYYDAYRWGFNASGSGAPTDDFMDLGLTSTAEGKRGMDSWHEDQRILSFLGRLNYDYDGKYIATFTFRQDGYSRLLGDNRWGFFPGVAAAWVLSRENFMENSGNWLNLLKLRASYGINGNVGDIGIYELQGSYGFVDGNNNKYDYLNNTGILLNGLPNSRLRWEKSATFEVGVDASFLGGRITASLGYYNRVTEDLLANIALPGTAGLTSLRTNNGSVGNYGIEFQANFIPIRTKDWEWSISTNFTWNENQVLKLPNNGNDRNRQGGTQVWDPAAKQLVWVGGTQEGLWTQNQWIGYRALGIWQSEEQIAQQAGNVADLVYSAEVGATTRAKGSAGPNRWASMTPAERSKYVKISPGDVIWDDIDGNDTIDARDRTVLGRTTPNFYGGLSMNLTWKNFNLYVRTDFGLGHVQFDFGRTWYLGSMQGAWGVSTDVNDTWTPENPNAKYPTYYWADQLVKNNYRYSSLMTYDASYLAFREVSLSYNFPAKLIEKAKMQALTLAVTGQNLGYLTAVQTNYGPEIGGNPGAYGAYQLPITLLFSAKITF